MRRLTIAVALLLLAPVALAQVYKWTDAHGTVHYSETPPAQSVHYTRITTTGSSSATAPQTPANPPEANRSEQPANSSSAAVADTPENRAAFCTSLKGNLDLLNSSTPVVRQDGGTTKALDDTQRKQEAATANAQYAQYCSAR
jgi:cytoskeletal protein RodZ